MTVSLLEILAAARAHAAPLAAESAGYLMLAVADLTVASPRWVVADDIELTGDGAVRLRARSGGAPTGSVEGNLRSLLRRTLEVSSSVGPGLRRAAARRGDVGLEALVRELETALIPVNRSAARRALSRLHRETERARSAGKLEALLVAEREHEASLAEPALAPEPRPAAPVAAPPVLAAPPSVATPMLLNEVPDLEISPLGLDAEPSPLALPQVVAAPIPKPSQIAAAPSSDLTPEPRIAVGEPALTKPEPVVVRSRERGSSTPRFGTIVTAQTLKGEEAELTERAPDVIAEDGDDPLEIEIDVELEPSVEPPLAETPTPVRSVALAPQPLLDPEPSTMPDVLLAMVSLHAGIEPEDAPTRLRDVVTAVEPSPLPSAVALDDAPTVEAADEGESVDDAWLTQSSLDAIVSAPVEVVAPAAEIEHVEVVPYVLFQSELAEPELHDALTWNPGPVVPLDAPLPETLLIAEPAPELSPLAPAVLPVRQSDVSELLDSFYVSGAAEEHELRSALKEMAGLELTPMPHPLASGR